MFSWGEIGLANRADREINDITNRYQRIVDKLKSAISDQDATISILETKLDKWISYGNRMKASVEEKDKQIQKIREKLSNMGMSAQEIEKIISQ